MHLHFILRWGNAQLVAPGRWVFLLGLTASLACCGCRPGSRTLHSATSEEIQGRTRTQFAAAELFKPVAPPANPPLGVELAPLFLRDLPTPTATARAPGITAVTLHTNKTQVASQTLAQFTFHWTCAGQPQAVRLTLNSAGLPVLWEIQHDTSGADLIYVSEALERAARAEFGLPEAGRTFSIERSPATAPQVVVPRLISDSPVAMGPILYLPAQGRDILALICRCMPAQFQSLPVQTNYQLRLDAGPVVHSRTWARPLDQRLRLPQRF